MVILRGIPRILSPQLLNTLARMGHGDEIVLADANFPSEAISRLSCSSFKTSIWGVVSLFTIRYFYCYRHGPELVRADGHNIPPLLKAVTKLLPLDAYVKCPVMLMDLVPEDKAKGLKTPVWGPIQADC